VPGQRITAGHVAWLFANRDLGMFLLDPIDPTERTIQCTATRRFVCRLTHNRPFATALPLPSNRRWFRCCMAVPIVPIAAEEQLMAAC
jgi:hypothetical protein